MTSSLLFDIAKKGSVKVLDTFLESNKDIDINIRNVDGCTALMISTCRNIDLVPTLINANADLNLQCEEGWTALMFAARFNTKALQLLLDAGADPNIKNKLGFTALMMAATYHSSITIATLIAAGADTIYAINHLSDENVKDRIRNSYPKFIHQSKDNTLYHIILHDDKYCDVQLLGGETRENVRYILDEGKEIELFYGTSEVVKMN